jgi:DNA repair protein RecN (Recombination protein N)
MLRQLQIINYVIIDEISIDFSGKLNVITGETGAGKSILMGALSLILGDRADTSVLLNREKKCFIEGVFKIENNPAAKAFLELNDLDADEELVIRREIAANGKSRAFVNDSPVNLDQLRNLCGMLVDLHRQFDTLELAGSDFQRKVLDALSGHDAFLKQYARVFIQFAAARKELTALQDQKSVLNKEFDYHSFLYEELLEGGFKENELEDLESALKILNNAEGIKTALSAVTEELGGGEQPVIQKLKILLNRLQPFSEYHPALSALLPRLQSVQIELQDISGELNNINNHVNYDPERIEQINERISKGYRLLKKHAVKTTNALLLIQHQLAEKLQTFLNMDDLILAKEKEVNSLWEEAKNKAKIISDQRKNQVKPLVEKVNRLLAQVGMPNARLKVEIHSGELNGFGMDSIEFLFDANKSNRFEPIRRVASGGELSRLMLCIKSLVAQSIDLATLIFDEIDTGISGEAARQVGIILKGLSENRQIICITHQPQIAGKGDSHYFVYKEIRGEAIKTNIRPLEREERITIIAKMLSGERPTAAALENAREMIMN